MTLTFVQNDFHHDTIFRFSRPTLWAQCVLAAVLQVVVVAHISAHPGHACRGAQGVRPAQLSFLCLTAHSPHTHVCLHHQGQQPFLHLLYSKTTHQSWRVALQKWLSSSVPVMSTRCTIKPHIRGIFFLTLNLCRASSWVKPSNESPFISRISSPAVRQADTTAHQIIKSALTWVRRHTYSYQRSDVINSRRHYKNQSSVYLKTSDLQFCRTESAAVYLWFFSITLLQPSICSCCASGENALHKDSHWSINAVLSSHYAESQTLRKNSDIFSVYLSTVCINS